MGPIELTCEGKQVSGRALKGITKGEAIWVPIKGEKVEAGVKLVFENDECEITYNLSEFENDRIYGQISSTGCKLLGKDFSYSGTIFLKRASQ